MIRSNFVKGGDIVNARCKAPFLICLLSLHGCGEQHVDTDIIARHESPVKEHTAFVAKKNYGATTSFVYNVYICKGMEFIEQQCGEEVFRADHLDDDKISIEWNTNRKVTIYTKDARIFHYNNMWYSREDVYAPPLRLRLVEEE